MAAAAAAEAAAASPSRLASRILAVASLQGPHGNHSSDKAMSALEHNFSERAQASETQKQRAYVCMYLGRGR